MAASSHTRKGWAPMSLYSLAPSSMSITTRTSSLITSMPATSANRTPVCRCDSPTLKAFARARPYYGRTAGASVSRVMPVRKRCAELVQLVPGRACHRLQSR